MVYEYTPFQGKAVHLKLRSDNSCYGPVPDPDDDRLHSLDLTEAGRVRYNVTKFGGKRKRQQFTVEPAAAKKLLDLLGIYFQRELVFAWITDVGTWALALENEAGDVYKYTGSLHQEIYQSGAPLSKAIRETLNLPGFFAFDCKISENHSEP